MGENPTGLAAVIKGVQDALADFSTVNLTSIFVGALTITVALVIGWFAYRFITRRVSKAMRKGSL